MRYYRIFCLFVLSTLLFAGCGSETTSESSIAPLQVLESSVAQENTESSEEISDMKVSYMKAVWLSQYDMSPLYRCNGIQRDKESFVLLLNKVLDNLAKDGYNTIFVQVRPFADAFYPSEFYPISSYVSGSYGVEDIYDPFEIVVEYAREYGFSVHAWVNPLRGMKVDEIENVPDRYLIKQWYNDDEKKDNYIVAVSGRLYLNPAHEEVRKLIADGAAELCKNYNIDGIHIDDYFYPTTDVSFDAASYAAYKQNGGTKSLANFRYDNINEMMRSMYTAIKAVDETLLFGVSPAGNLNSTYTTSYTDVYTWCSEEGYIDYICPQIYFGLEHQTHDFKKVYTTWKNIIKNENIKLFVGMTLGKAQSGVDNYAGTGIYEWQNNKDVLKRCLQYLDKQEECQGIVLFCYQYMYDPLTGKEVAQTKQERDNMKEIFESLGEESK